ncbi:pyrroline-5-carboxylate reductase [Salirhabdus euzebyi]|uniref:Pyrroline-5-carboxylate reductase n=2 Tax=Salirhabdus euzebyi TaxID=394506 RepID=A0A841Q7P8_9BACI|nr:pyrroline-5-carboxylate reductase [Salirhabdus euzebyi]
MVNKIAFIGAGSMAEAIITGILNKGVIKPHQVYITNKDNQERLDRLNIIYHVPCMNDKKEVMKEADIVILSVKPKDAQEALHSIRPFVKKEQLIVSVLAGISTEFIEEQLGVEVPVIRAMPNTSAAIGHSATAVAKGKHARKEHLENAISLFQTIGTTTVVEEEDLHAVTGLSGSGPAYIYYLVEAMEDAAQQAGLQKEISKELIVQTLVGAAEMLKTTQETPSALRKKITSPGGTTQAGIETLEKYKYQEALIECIKNAKARSVELGKLFEQTNP